MTNHSLDILLIEDNPHDAELAIRALGKNNLADNLIHIQDGQEALDFLFGTGTYEGRDVQHQPKVVFLDLKLPKVDGMEVLRQMRADARTRLMPVVVLSSSREDCDLLQAYELGANSYIVKPVGCEIFAKAVSDLGLYWLSLNESPFVKS
jgi:CheY-like chemotaxis protein